MSGVTRLLWFRRDLRLHDLPALVEAGSDGADVLACYVLDPRLTSTAGPRRLQFLYDSLRELSDALDGKLLVTRGKPETRIPQPGQRNRRDVRAHFRRLLAVRDTPRRRGPRGAGRRRAARRGFAVPGVAGTGGQGRRRTVQGVHAVLPALARPRVAGPGELRDRVRAVDRPRGPARSGEEPRHPRPGYAAEHPGRREGGPAAVDPLCRRTLGRLRRQPRPTGSGHHQPHVGVPALRQHPPADHGRRSRHPRCRAAGVPARAGVPRLLRRRAGGLAAQRVVELQHRLRHHRGRRRPRRRAAVRRHGRTAAPGSRSSTRACGSCARPASCTTGCG